MGALLSRFAVVTTQDEAVRDGLFALGLPRAEAVGDLRTAAFKRAIDKARLSRNPVAVEPGRYTVILEPQAVSDLLGFLAGGFRKMLQNF